MHAPSDWRLHGVRVVHATELDANTPQTPGMDRAAAITAARAGAEKLWAGTVQIHPDAKTGAHHHGSLESVIYVVSGRARMRWGERLEFSAEAGPGDFIFVPPFVPHQEINASADAPLSCVVVRSGQEAVVVNLDLPDVEPNPEQVHWVDDIHSPDTAPRLGPSSSARTLGTSMQQMLEANHVNLCAETFGDPSHPPLLLISGASGSMDWWRTEFCRRLADGGRRVIRYDHRDTGQSSHSRPGAPDYSGSDLVADAVGLLDALGIESAHIAGISMGGGIGQVLALDHPQRVRSLTLMSTSPLGADLPPPTAALAARFASPAPPPDWSNRGEVIDYIVAEHRAFTGTLPFDAGEVRALAAGVVDRTIDIEASMTNHWLVGGGAPLRPRLGQIAAPTLVIHGTQDPLFPLPHGEALAREIAGRLIPIEGMGHEVPPRPVWDQVIAAILEHTRASDYFAPVERSRSV